MVFWICGFYCNFALDSKPIAMRIKYACLLAFLTGLVACDNSMEDGKLPSEDIGPRNLCINAQEEVVTKEQMSGTYLPDNSTLGIFLLGSDGGLYNSTAYNNVPYISSGTAAEQVWSPGSGNPITLTEATGSAYAYFPYTSGVSYEDITAIPITNNGTDWMYGSEASTNLSNLNNTASFTLKHACTIIRCSIHQGTYVGTGVVNSVKMQCDAFATGATMDLTVPQVSGFSGLGTTMELTDWGTMSGEDLKKDFWAIPAGTTANLKFTIDVDGNTYIATKVDFTPVAGAVYPFTLTVNSVEATVEVSGITPWEFLDKGEYFPAP